MEIMKTLAVFLGASLAAFVLLGIGVGMIQPSGTETTIIALCALVLVPFLVCGKAAQPPDRDDGRHQARDDDEE